MEKDYSWKLGHVNGFVELRVEGMPLLRVYDSEMLNHVLQDRKDEYKKDPSDVNKLFLTRYEDGLKLLEGREI